MPRGSHPHFFALSRLRIQSKKEHSSSRKSESTIVWKKKREFVLFCPFSSWRWKLSSRAQSHLQGEKQGSCVRCILGMNTTFHAWLSHQSCSIATFLYQISCSDSPVLAELSWQSCGGSPVLTVLWWQSWSVCSVLLALPGYPILAVLFWLSCHSCPVRAVLFWMASPFCSPFTVLS
jgi:hypothetical protein